MESNDFIKKSRSWVTIPITQNLIPASLQINFTTDNSIRSSNNDHLPNKSTEPGTLSNE